MMGYEDHLVHIHHSWMHYIHQLAIHRPRCCLKYIEPDSYHELSRFILWVNQHLKLVSFHIAVHERGERKFIWIKWISWTYLFHFGESQVQSGVNPGQYLVPSHKVRRIHHPNVWCPHLFFFSPSEKTTQKQSRQIKNLPHKMTLRDHQRKCRSTHKTFQTVEL